ncbi:glycosyltransferase family 2 protein [Alicyclobacillus tolerans]|uniref:glycosyltransferase family 2 protein n=1 Tax=Alicyclobacillus tolerans TaxID=90970 RepID=UPI001F2DE13A|nr:glycosyltransferase family 2 protein [Alicyclobacillus tolerans]MCF8567768.1 glycosyltransferase family 2 protein [Alicyclobacillus tolerans]
MQWPKVSILIPTYNRPRLFELALNSALEQDYKNIEIVICDDSTNDETAQLVEKYQLNHKNIFYHRNEQRLGQFNNDVRLFELAQGEYINYLMDDDLFHPNKISKMMRYFLSEDGSLVALVTSHRQVIDEHGNHIPDLSVTAKLFEKDTKLNGRDAARFMLQNNFNFIGEPTTVLFRKSDIERFGAFAGRDYGCNVDQATWLRLLGKGSLVYCSDTLSYFRLHGNQQLVSTKMVLKGAADYEHAVLHATSEDFFSTNETAYIQTIRNCLKYSLGVLTRTTKTEQLTEEDLWDFEEIRELSKRLMRRLPYPSQVNELPLVSVLIPANDPRYLQSAVDSVLMQTYPNVEIVVCDASTNDSVQQSLLLYTTRHSNIHYIRNESNRKVDSMQTCLNYAKGELISFLLDDDLFHENKLEKMVRYYLTQPNVKLISSFLQPFDDTGKTVDITGWPTPLFNEDRLVLARELGDLTLLNAQNIIGEPSAVLFVRDALGEQFGYFHGERYDALSALASLLSILSEGNAIYIAEPLSYIRQRVEHNEQKTKIIARAIPELFHLIRAAHDKGFLVGELQYKKSLLNHIRQVSYLMDALLDRGQLDESLDKGAVEREFATSIATILS